MKQTNLTFTQRPLALAVAAMTSLRAEPVAALSGRPYSGVAVAACVVELPEGKAPTEIQLFPAGAFRARDGRPGNEHPFSDWWMDADAAHSVIDKAADAVGDFVLDYEHQTLYAETSGQPAPASGWFKRLEWREDDGLYATDVRWTARAGAMIEAREYRYISPVFGFDKKTGTVTDILMAAVTNYPAIDGHSDLAARAAARYGQPGQSTNSAPEETTVDRKKLIELLGLAEDATDEQIEAAIKAGADAGKNMEALRSELSVAAGGDAKSAVVALKQKAETAKPDMSQYVPKAVYDESQTALTALKGQSETAELDRLIEEGLDDGRIAGKATADWLREQGLVALKAHLKDAPNIAALKGTQTDGKEPPENEADAAGLTDEEREVARLTGRTPKEYAALKVSGELA